MSSPLAPHLSLPEGQQLAVATMELPRDNADQNMDSPSSARGKHTFGTAEPLAPKPGAGKREPLFLSDSESGKRTLSSTKPENDFCMNVPSF